MTKVAMEAVDAVRRRLAVEIPAGEVTAEIERAYEQLRRRARVPGFRPGRAPRPVLEKMFGDQIRADVYGKLVQDSYADALREQQISPVSMPEIVTEQAEPGAPLRYSATVEVKPEIVARDYVGIAVERPRRSVSDDDVMRVIEAFQQRHATLTPITDRDVAQRGDVATIDYVARVGDAVVGRGDQRLVEIGGEPADSPGAKLEGARVGEPTQFAIDYPADHGNAELAGKTVHFDATLRALSRRDVPALDDAFASAHAGCETIEQLRSRVREDLEATAAREAAAAVRGALVGKLVAAHDFEVPQAMIDRRAEAMAEDVLDSLGPRRPPASREADVRRQLQHDLQPQARDHVKGALLLESVAAQEQLSVDDAELDAHIDRLAEAAGKARERVRHLYHDPNARAGLRARLLQERAIDLLIQRAVITDVDGPSGVAGVPGNG